MKECSLLIERYGGAKKVISMMEGLWEISYSTANRIYNETQLAFGDFTKFDKQYHIDTYIQFLITGINKARDNDDGKTFTGLMKEYKAAIHEFMGTSDADLYKQIQIPDFQVGFFPDELKTKLPANWKSRVKKLVEEKKRADEIEDAIVLEPSEDNGAD